MKLLVIKMSSLGDVVQARESLACIPHATVDWVIEKPFKELIEGYVSRTLVVETKKWRKNPFKYRTEILSFIKLLREESYDAVLDLQGNFKSSLVLMFAKGKKKIGFGSKTVPEKINLLFTSDKVNPPKNENIRLDYRAIFDAAFPIEDVKKEGKISNSYTEVMICPGSMWKNKQLPLPALKDFLELFSKKYSSTFHFLWGNEEEKVVAEDLQKSFSGSTMVPRLSLTQLESKIKEMDLLIGMDSFPLHLAGACNIPTWGLFGPSSATKYSPVSDQAFFFQGTCPYGRTFEKRCPILRTCPTGACLRERTGKEIFDHFEIATKAPTR